MMGRAYAVVPLVLCLLQSTEAFSYIQTPSSKVSRFSPACSTTRFRPLFLSADASDDDGEDAEPGKMRVSEIKAELDMRGVSYRDCFDKESLVERLEEARATGKANPDILNKFNKQQLEQKFNEEKVDIKDEDIDKALANDGKLPGGMSPDMMKTLMGNPEIMALLQNPKMQEAMKLMMTGGREDLEKALASDPELQSIVQKLNVIMRGT